MVPGRSPGLGVLRPPARPLLLMPGGTMGDPWRSLLKPGTAATVVTVAAHCGCRCRGSGASRPEPLLYRSCCQLSRCPRWEGGHEGSPGTHRPRKDRPREGVRDITPRGRQVRSPIQNGAPDSLLVTRLPSSWDVALWACEWVQRPVPAPCASGASPATRSRGSGHSPLPLSPGTFPGLSEPPPSSSPPGPPCQPLVRGG